MFAVRSRACAIPLIALVLVGASGPAHGATEATLVGKVFDSEGEPLKGIGVTVRGGDFERRVTSDKKGRVRLTVPDAAAEYEIRFDREGYPSYSEPLRFPKGGILSLEWTLTLTPLGSPTDSMAALLLYNAGVDAYNEGDMDLALQKMGEAVKEDPELMEAHSVIAGIYHAREDHEPASLAAERVLALDPENAEALRIRYIAYLELGRKGTGEILDRLAELDRTRETAVLLYNDGVTARVAGDRARALARYELASQLDPSLAEAHSGLAGLHLAMKNYDAALASSERLLELDPENARGLSLRYNTYIAMGRNEEAQAMLEALQQAAPDAVARAYFDRGTALFDDGRIDGAIPALEQAIAADPKLARGHYTLALCYMNRNRNEEASRHLETFIELAPDDPDAGSAAQLLEILNRSD